MYIVRMSAAPPESIKRDALLAEVRRLGRDLASALRTAGYKAPAGWFNLAPHQLVNWHRNGLIPRPTRRFLGRNRGTESRYPAHTALQAAAVAMMQLLFRDLKSTAWAVWCLGFDLTERVRADLVAEVAGWEQRLGKNYRLFEEGRPNNPIAQLATGRAPRGFGNIRRRVGKRRFDTVGRVFHEVLLGNFGPQASYDPSDYRLIAKAVGVVGGEAPVARLPEALALLSREANLSALRRAIVTMPAGTLCLLRDEAQAIFRSLPVGDWIAQALVPPEFVIWWIGLRYTSPMMRAAFNASASAMFWGHPDPPLLVRLHRDLQAAERTRAPRRKRTRSRAGRG